MFVKSIAIIPIVYFFAIIFYKLHAHIFNYIKLRAIILMLLLFVEVKENKPLYF